jgi:tetratricopeptide (TPR) repeat protein
VRLIGTRTGKKRAACGPPSSFAGRAVPPRRARRGSLGIGGFAVLALALCFACGRDFDPAQALREGLAQQQAGHIEKAAELYQQILDVRPGDTYANYNMGVIEQRDGRTQLAEGYYRTALQSDPVFVPALFNLAIIRTGVGATDEAISLYKRVIEARSDYAAAHFNLALLYAAAGRDRLGEEALSRALALDPSLSQRLGTGALPAGTEAKPSDQGQSGESLETPAPTGAT